VGASQVRATLALLSADPTTNGELQPAALPSAGPVRVLERRRFLPALPISNALVAVGGGFLAGLVAIATLRAVRGTRLTRRGRKAGKDQVTRRVVAKRSFLIDVHLLGK
jgi:hypothetical protein